MTAAPSRLVPVPLCQPGLGSSDWRSCSYVVDGVTQEINGTLALHPPRHVRPPARRLPRGDFHRPGVPRGRGRRRRVLVRATWVPCETPEMLLLAAALRRACYLSADQLTLAAHCLPQLLLLQLQPMRPQPSCSRRRPGGGGWCSRAVRLSLRSDRRCWMARGSWGTRIGHPQGGANGRV